MNSGIYILYNIFTGRRYVGSSRNLKHRRTCHFSGMKNGTHENYKIRNECSTYGVDSFRWEILERCEIGCLVEREQWWMDSLKPELNIILTADNHNCTETERRKEARKRQAEKITGRKQSQEEKDKRAKSIKEFWAKPENVGKKIVSQEQRRVLSEKNTGANNPNWGKPRSEESKQKSSQSNSKVRHIFHSPDGKLVEIINPYKNSVKLTGLSYSVIRKMYTGRQESSKGWTFVRSESIETPSTIK